MSEGNSSKMKTLSAVLGIIGGMTVIIGFPFAFFTFNTTHDADIKRVEAKVDNTAGLTAQLIQQLVTDLNENKLDIKRTRIESVIDALRVRRDFLRNKIEINPVEAKELSILEKVIIEYKSLID